MDNLKKFLKKHKIKMTAKLVSSNGFNVYECQFLRPDTKHGLIVMHSLAPYLSCKPDSVSVFWSILSECETLEEHKTFSKWRAASNFDSVTEAKRHYEYYLTLQKSLSIFLGPCLKTAYDAMR